MSGFKESIQIDLSIFFSINEFAEIHNIGGRELSIVVDDERLAKRTQKDYQGIYVGDLLFFIRVLELGPRPKPESIILFDNKPYTVFDVQEDNGVYEIILKASEH